MIPLRTSIPRRKYPALTLLLIAVNVVVFLYQVSLPDEKASDIIYEHGFIPLRLTAAIRGVHEISVPIRQLKQRGHYVFVTESARPMASDPASVILSLFSSMFLHGGWAHIIGNMLYLWTFGPNIEDRLGKLAYITFYLFCGLCAAGLQMLFDSTSPMPMVGASGAIAGVLGAYIVSYPLARVLTLLPIFFFWQFVEVPALIFLGFWFVLQFFGGIGSVSRIQGGGVAYWAHVGGFAAGLAIMWVAKRLRPRRPSPPKVEIIYPAEQWRRDAFP